MSFGVPTGAVGSAVQAGRELFSLLLPARIEGLEKASSRFFIEPEHEKTRQDAYAGAEQQIDGEVFGQVDARVADQQRCGDPEPCEPARSEERRVGKEV